MLTATRIRLYPTDVQQQLLACQFGCSRWVWNEGLAECQRYYKETGKHLGYAQLCKRLPLLKTANVWLADAVAQALQQSLRNLTRAFSNFFGKRAFYPKFKSKSDRQSVQYPQRVVLDKNSVVIPKLGPVRAVIHRTIAGEIKTVTVTKEPCGHYYASVLTDNGAPTPIVLFDSEQPVLGVDLGLKEFAVSSAGQHYGNPRHLTKHERNLKRKQQKLSRKQRGSKSRNKARQLVARAHERVKNARKDALHKLSTTLVCENQAIAVEDLCVKGMVRSHNLAKAVSDAGWGSFTAMLAYKCERVGKAFVRVDRWYPSTRTCSHCGVLSTKVSGVANLNVRRWTCDSCGTTHDRDENAAKNIAAEGWRLLTAPGAGVAAVGGEVSLA